MPERNHDLVIIGGGPAGLTAGLYAARSGIDTIMIERFVPGGQVLNTDWVENYPGFPDGVTGFALVDKMKAQVDKFDLPSVSAEVESLAPVPGGYRLGLGGAEAVRAKAVIITSGAEPRRLDVPGELTLTGHGVSYCGTCDGPFYKDLTVACVGGGDTACEEAVYITRFAAKVHLIHRRDRFRAQKVVADRVMANEKISVIWDTAVEAVDGQEKVDAVRLVNLRTGERRTLPVDGVFVFVGSRPMTAFVQGLLDLDGNGFILTDTEMATKLPGVFAAGDCRHKQLRQISTAVGDGATAAFSAQRYLESLADA